MKLSQRWKQTALHNKALVTTSILVAFGTVFYAGAAIFQICIMKQSARDSADQINRLVGATNASIDKSVAASSKALTDALKQNKEALDASLSQAKAALDASTRQSKAVLDSEVKVSQETLRPYIHVVAMDMLGTVEEGQRFQAQAQVANTGRSPGIHVSVCADVTIRESAFSLPDGFVCPAPGNPPELPEMVRSEMVIGPSNPPVYARSRGTTFTPANQPGTLLPLLNTRALLLYFYGDIRYAELLDHAAIHHTEFCAIYRPDTHMFDSCEHHNNAD